MESKFPPSEFSNESVIDELTKDLKKSCVTADEVTEEQKDTFSKSEEVEVDKDEVEEDEEEKKCDKYLIDEDSLKHRDAELNDEEAEVIYFTFLFTSVL